MNKKVWIAFLGFFVAFSMAFSGLSQAQGPLKLGVLAKRGKAKANKKWKPLVEYLSKTTGKKFVLLPLSFDAIEPAVKNKKIDYLLANPGFYVNLQKKYGLSALTTMLNSRQGKALNKFGGVIFVKADSPVQALPQLKGKKFMCVKMSSFGGAQMGFRHLIEKGINPFKDFTGLKEGFKHDNVVISVKNGLVDAGTVRSDTLERMDAEGKIRMSDFRVLDRVSDDFPFVHTTVLYPEWPFAALPHTDSGLNARVKKALLNLSKDDPAAKAAKIAGWTEPLDYSPVAKCLEVVAKAK